MRHVARNAAAAVPRRLRTHAPGEAAQVQEKQTAGRSDPLGHPSGYAEKQRLAHVAARGGTLGAGSESGSWST
jgi:hypothetical protein